MADIELRAEVASQSAKFCESLKYISYAEMQFSTPEDVNHVAGILASICPDPETASQGLVELLLNAVEHGNLGITYEEKKQYMFNETLESELKRRLLLPEYMYRKASVSFKRNDSALEFIISDQGNGFDWEKYLVPDPARVLDPNGRGIAMARRFSFSNVEFHGAGNVVKATLSLGGA
jgi:anti-sigma regulatory factor (Ser/Thr protein kinase)